jgi:hypothetical protein
MTADTPTYIGSITGPRLLHRRPAYLPDLTLVLAVVTAPDRYPRHSRRTGARRGRPRRFDAIERALDTLIPAH